MLDGDDDAAAHGAHADASSCGATWLTPEVRIVDAAARPRAIALCPVDVFGVDEAAADAEVVQSLLGVVMSIGVMTPVHRRHTSLHPQASHRSAMLDVG